MEKEAQVKQASKEEAKQEMPKVEAVQAKESQPKESAPTPKPEAKKPLTLDILKKQIDLLAESVTEHGLQIAELQQALSQKRKPTNNGKVQIRDKQTGKVYPSKNNCYQTLLKSGELKELVDKGIFGSDPAKNSFGWYALVRAWPDRFEEIKLEQSKEAKPEQVEGKA